LTAIEKVPPLHEADAGNPGIGGTDVRVQVVALVTSAALRTDGSGG
jgi:hypothetical protein